MPFVRSLSLSLRDLWFFHTYLIKTSVGKEASGAGDVKRTLPENSFLDMEKFMKYNRKTEVRKSAKSI